MKLKSGVYRIRCSNNGRIYIGSTIDLDKRRRSHRNDLERGQHSNRYLQRAWNKYGEASFFFMVLERVHPEVLVDTEQRYIDELNTTDPKRGFNLSPAAGSTLGYKYTDEQRAAASRRAKKADHSHLRTPEAKAKVRKSNQRRAKEVGEMARLRWADPVCRQKMQEKMRASAQRRWTDPVRRAKALKAMLAHRKPNQEQVT
jgi:group I intron endonuclease